MAPSATENGSAAAAATTLEQAPALLIQKLSDKAHLPTRGSAFAAGYDLYAAKEATIPARGKALVDTDIAISVPAGTCMSSFSPMSLPPCFHSLLCPPVPPSLPEKPKAQKT
jgi:hypothetical protein